MATLAWLKAKIASDLHRSDLTTQITDAVTSAIDHYSRESFWFMEGSSTFTTSASQVAYTASTSLRSINTVLAQVSGSKYPVKVVHYKDIDEMDTGIETGQPIYMTYWDNAYRFYPNPNGAYPITISYTRDIGEPSASGSNAWTTHGKELIRFRAEWDIYQNYLRNGDMAAVAKNSEMDALMSLSREDRGRRSTGTLRKSGF